MVSRAKARGFSLLELIGVMAIMAILAAALAPSVFRMIEDSYQDAEATSLTTIATSMAHYIRRDKTIPTQTLSTWSAAVADYASLAPQNVTDNPKGFQRRLYVDPQFFTTANQNFPGYTQTNGLTQAPNSPRMMFVSNLEGSVTANITTGTQFEAVWSQAGSPSIVETKTLLIERLNLAQVFMRVILSNANSAQAGYQLEGATVAAVPGAVGGSDGTRTVFLIADTRLQLNASPFPIGGLLRQLIVDEELSMRYELVGANWAWVGS